MKQGRFEDSSMYLTVDVFGMSEELRKPLKGIIDTGFAGYLTLPYALAFPLGLVLKGEQPVQLADGSIVRHFICIGTIVFENKEYVVPITIQQSGPVLIGMELLKKFGYDLNIQFSTETFQLVPSKNKSRSGLPNVKIKI